MRDARPEEYAEVARVTVQAYAEYAAALGQERWDRYSAELASVDRRAGEAALIVAEEGGSLVGAVAYYPPVAAYARGFGVPPGATPPARSWPEDWASIRVLAVAPSHRGRGIGRLLVDECILRARSAGAPVIALHTVGFMQAAQRMYERMGFRRLPEYEDPDRPVLAYGLELSGEAAEATAPA